MRLRLPVRVVRQPDSIVYTVYEHELDIIRAGPPATLALNFAVALISIGVSLAVALATTTISADWLFCSYLIACFNCLIAGTYLFGYWLTTRTTASLVRKIRSRLTALPSTQGRMPTDLTGV